MADDLQPERHAIVISRAAPFTEPRPITIDVVLAGKTITRPLDDYLIELAEAMGNPALLLTKAQLLAKLNAASAQVIYAMKAAILEVL